MRIPLLLEFAHHDFCFNVFPDKPAGGASKMSRAPDARILRRH